MKLYNDFIRDMSSFGSSYFIAGLIIFSWFLDVTLGNRLLVAFVLSLVVVYIIKNLFFVPRPVPDKPKNFLEKIDAASFPSAHASRAAIIAAQLALWFQHWLFTVLIIIFGVLIAWSRVVLKRHRWIDVVVGAGIGVLSVWAAQFIIVGV